MSKTPSKGGGSGAPSLSSGSTSAPSSSTSANPDLDIKLDKIKINRLLFSNSHFKTSMGGFIYRYSKNISEPRYATSLSSSAALPQIEPSVEPTDRMSSSNGHDMNVSTISSPLAQPEVHSQLASSFFVTWLDFVPFQVYGGD